MTTETKATPTPGPWCVSDLDKHVIGPVRVLHANGTNVPQLQAVARVCERLDETEANAHLIAAAPDLLAALEDVLAQFETGAFVRNTNSDGCSDWALKAAAPLRALAAAQRAVAKAKAQ